MLVALLSKLKVLLKLVRDDAFINLQMKPKRSKKWKTVVERYLLGYLILPKTANAKLTKEMTYSIFGSHKNFKFANANVHVGSICSFSEMNNQIIGW